MRVRVRLLQRGDNTLTWRTFSHIPSRENAAYIIGVVVKEAKNQIGVAKLGTDT